MAFDPFDVNAPHLAYVILGGFTVCFGLFSLVIKERLYIGEAPIATILGIIIGPYALNFFDPYSWGGSSLAVTDEITLEVTRVVIAIGVFAVGVELPKAYMKRHWRSLFFLLGPCMVYGWMISALLMWGLIPGLDFLSTLVIAACVTPTDPILAQAVVGGKFADKHVPTHIRHLLSAESGSNDGAAFPFLYIALYLTLDASPGHAVGEWFYMTWLYEVTLGIVIGSLLGFSARKVMRLAERKKFIDRQSYVAQYVSLAVLSIGICTLLGSDDLLAAFACGCAFAWDGFFNKATEDAVFSNVIDLLFNCAAFIYIGAIIPFTSFQDAAINLSVWRLVVLAILILLVRRLPVILALYKFIPDIKTFREAAFVGWFGPMGVGAIFISTLARSNIPEPENDGDTSQVDLLQETIGPIVAFLVLSSVLTHGLSIPFFSLSRRVHSITYTWSRNPSMDARGDEPAWTTHARRLAPGQQVVINRDEEEGDIGLQNREGNGLHREKRGAVEDDSGQSWSIRSRREVGEDGIEMGEKRRAGNDEELELEDHTRTPPLAEFREGHHLVVERRGESDGEVHVEVYRNHFHDDEPTESVKFTHPRRLNKGEIERLTADLSKSLDHVSAWVREGRRDAKDRLLGRRSEESAEGSGSGPREGSPRHSDDGDHSTNAGSDNEEDGDGFVRRRPYAPAPVRSEADNDTRSVRSSEHSPERRPSPAPIHSYIPAARLQQKKNKEPAWRRFFRRGSSPSAHVAAEEGRGREARQVSMQPESENESDYEYPDQVETGFLAPPITVTRPDGLTPVLSRTGDDDRGLQLTRTISARAIRFAPDSSVSSDTAPTMANYGVTSPGFRRNPTLGIYRTTSVQSTGSNKEGPSVSFKEPDKAR